jgi:putative DNA primase/helicase
VSVSHADAGAQYRAPSDPPDLVVEAIPAELRDRDQWVCWRRASRGEKLTKVPYQTNGTKAATDDPSTWTTFDAALAAYRAGRFHGVGYVFSAEDPYVGVDIDHATADPDRLTWALGIVNRFDTYAEWSPSGAGIHIIGRGRLPGGGHNDQKQGLEIYDRGRFFTFTGNVVEVCP